MILLARRFAHLLSAFLLSTFILAAVASAAGPSDVPLIPRAKFFGSLFILRLVRAASLRKAG